jgi:hypothetical protein
MCGGWPGASPGAWWAWGRGVGRRLRQRGARRVSYDTLLSVYALKYQKHAMLTMYTHRAEMGNYYRQCACAPCRRRHPSPRQPHPHRGGQVPGPA